MAYEFKKLSDVDVVETTNDSTNVLIEENGVIKKAPKTTFGSANSNVESADLVIEVNGDFLITEDNYSIVEGSTEAVINAMREGRVPNVKIRFLNNLESIGNGGVVVCAGEINAFSLA